MDLFSFDYTFALTYRSHSNNMTLNGDAQFQTGRVWDNNGTCFQYYKWPSTVPFTHKMEILPNAYTFSFTAIPPVICTVNAGQTLYIPGCSYTTPKLTADPVSPQVFALEQNYPNPFNPSTVIEYNVPDDVPVLLQVIDTHGRVVSTLVNEYKTAGTYSVKFDAADLPSGMYIYRLQSAGNTITKTMTLLK